MRAKKSFGQHFLINENLAGGIVQSVVESAHGLPLLEIGPGKGVLTKYIIDLNANFMAVDADQDMIGYLRDKYPLKEDRFILKDILQLNTQELFDGGDYVIFGNFPYNISSQILFLLLSQKERVPLLIGMFQKEVARRVVSKEGSKEYGIISVLIQAHYDAKIIYQVGPESFSPPPKVDSAVIMLTRKKNFTINCNQKLFKSIVKMSFGQRRKMMRNSLKALVADETILTKDVFSRRPESLSLEEFISLTQLIESQR